MSAIGPFECAKCGQIKQSEFPAEIQSKIKSANSLRIIIVMVIIFVFFWLLFE